MLIRIFLFVILGLGSIDARAQKYAEKYTVSHYTDENGLPQNSVKSIAADKNGFIWLATENGLVRFDGQHFYTFDKSNSSLLSPRFYSLLPDLTGHANRIYAIGDNMEDILRIDGPNALDDSTYNAKQLSRVPHSNTNRDRLASGLPNNLIQMTDRLLQYYIVLVPSRIGTFYIIQRNKIEFFTDWKKSWEIPYKSTDFASYFISNGDLFSSSPDGDLFRFKAGGLEAIRLDGDILDDANQIAGNKKIKIFWNNISDQVFIKSGKKFYYVDDIKAGKCKTRLILDDFELDAPIIQTVYFDKQKKRLFLGSSTQGLFVFTGKDFQTIRFGINDADNAFYTQSVYGKNLVVTPQGSILGLIESGTKKGEVFNRILPVISSGFERDGYSIVTDKQGNIWSKSGYHLYQYDTKGEKLLGHWDMGNQIYTMYMDDHGRIWLGIQRLGLFYIDPSRPAQKPSKFIGPVIVDIKYITSKDDEKLWLTTDHGLFSVQIASGKTVLIPGTEKLIIRSIYFPDKSKNNIPENEEGVFLATMGDGIIYYTGNKLIRFPLDNNKIISAAHYIVEDKKGFLWIPTNKGLFQFAKKDFLRFAKESEKEITKPEKPFFVYYNKENGFFTNEFNGGAQPGAVRLPTGQVSLPSMNGLVWFTPEKITPELPDKSFFYDRLEIRGKVSLINGDTITLGKDPRQINLHITTPYYGNNYNLNLSYAVNRSGSKPVASDWIELKSSDPTIRFSELSSGEYTVTVRKVNGFGENNFSTKIITIIVPRHWYETFWFRLFCVLMFLGVVFLFIRSRTRYLEKQNQALEMKIKARTQSLEETLQRLRISEKELTKQMHIRTRLVASISHDIRTPMKFLIYASEKIDPLLSAQRYDQVSMIGNNITTSARQISRLLENMIQYIKTQFKGENIKFTEVFLHTLISEKISLFNALIQEQENTFISEISEEITVLSNMHLLGVVIHNIIDNANKYTFNGEIRIYTETREDKVLLIIADSGPGISSNLMHWLNAEDDASQKALEVSQEFNGLGLLMIKEITYMLNIELLVDNTKGTKFHLIFRGNQED
ncbi:two-component regulator propeller domain-containing protein [Dyadobacter sp. CY356]|uniref:ligand-binding sensor domain-containing protein n=1 Tax=Dyadobacter sp. CY356 TaxID=2906442 RepID=UPI001F191B3E|nr:sensor histidine kinase [Dyadobacter sp. CY356]MCF0056097.1 ATP-binding protein [Dyadobacter sp. CY356]